MSIWKEPYSISDFIQDIICRKQKIIIMFGPTNLSHNFCLSLRLKIRHFWVDCPPMTLSLSLLYLTESDVILYWGYMQMFFILFGLSSSSQWVLLNVLLQNRIKAKCNITKMLTKERRFSCRRPYSKVVVSTTRLHFRRGVNYKKHTFLLPITVYSIDRNTSLHTAPQVSSGFFPTLLRNLFLAFCPTCFYTWTFNVL